MKATLCTALLAALITLPATAQDNAQEHLLRLQHQAGKTQFFRQAMDMRMKMNAGGMNMDTTMSFEMVIETKVAAVAEGKADLEQTIRRLVVKMDNPMMQVDYDSDNPDSDPGMLEGMTHIVGKTFKMKADDRGGLSDVKIPEGFDAESAGMFGGGDMTKFFSQNMPQLPEGPVAIGGTWETKTQMPMGNMGGGEVKVQNKLAKFEGGKATIEQTMQIDTSSMELPEGAKMEVKKAGGTSVLNCATGLLDNAEMKMEMTMQADQGGMKMDMEMNMTTKMTAIDPPPAKKVEAPKTGEAKTDEGKGGDK